MEKSEYAQYLRQRQLKKCSELSKLIEVAKDKYEEMIKALPDDAIIDSNRICSHYGTEWLSKKKWNH